jgi:hypothetical protein
VYSPCNRPSKDSDELPNSKTLISSFNLLLVLNEQDPAFINYCKKSIVFFAKALELEETHQKEPFFSKHVATIFSKAAEFEKTLNSIP